ncbi:MAG: TraB/GumN family protein, partial [Steroidobacteraceae bacterium]
MSEHSNKRLPAALLVAIATLAGGESVADPALWAVSSRGNTVYVFGSVHLLPEGGFAIGGALAEALEDAERVCLELDPDEHDEANTMRLTLARAIDPEGRSLFDLLGPDADHVRASAEAAGIDIAQFAAFEPWFAGLTVSLLALQQHGYDGKHGVEMIIEAAAKEAGKPVCALETLDAQLAMLDTMPARSQRDLLLQAIDEADEVDELIRPLLAAWRDGDEEHMERRLAEDIADYPDLADPLIFDRNERWADQVSEMLEGDD